MTRVRRIALACMTVMLGVAAICAQTSYPAGNPLIGAPANWRLTSGNATAAEVDVSGTSFARAFRVETRVDTSPSWGIEYKTPVTRAVARGDVALLRFLARATATTDESGAAYLRLVVQRASPEWDKSIEGTHTVTREWQEYFVPFTFAADYAAGAAEIAFGFGFKRQTVEIGGIDFIHYGRSVPLASLPRTRPTYFGRESGAAWRDAALARIEQLRKGDFAIAVVDREGRAVPGASVRVTQRTSAFQFGSALQMARLVNETADNRRYRQKVLELFNAGGPENDLKWPAWSGEWGGAYSRAQTLAGLAWLKQHGLHTRGHVLVWPGWNNLPASIRALRGTAQQPDIPARVLAHIADVAGATRALVDEWDVLNEPFTNHDLMDVFGASIQAGWFAAARAAHPAAPLFLNDYGNHDAALDAAHVAHFEATARTLQSQGAPLGGLGVQAHISASPSAPANVLAVLDRYAALGLPVRITEFDINSDDEELQADYTRDFLIAVFSHPSVVGFQLWGFWEGAHWIPRAAMYRMDWSEKPNARAYKSVVLDQWRTRAQGTTDAAGRWRGRGFHGDYVVSVEHGGTVYEQVFTLRAGAAPLEVRVPLAPTRLVNLSTRASAGAGEAALIPGFFVDGSVSRRVLVRGIGPGLAAFGVAGALGPLELALRAADGSLVATNRGWDSAGNTASLADTMRAVGAFPLQPGSGDCALVATLAPGAYTAPVVSLDGSGGIALVEAYDLDSADSGRLRNLSTRAHLGAGGALVIPGFVLAGENARTVLVRAIGPGLAPFGVADPLAQPSLAVMSERGTVAANAGWETSADPATTAAAAARVGAFALRTGARDAAVVATLAPGAWTIQVTSADNSAGTVLVEVYDVGS